MAFTVTSGPFTILLASSVQGEYMTNITWCPYQPGPFLDATVAAIGAVTDVGDSFLQRVATPESPPLVFRITHYDVGTGGYDPLNPTQTTPIDTSLTTLESPVHRQVFDNLKFGIGRYLNNNQTLSCLCRIPFDLGAAEHVIGEIGLVATIEQSMTPAEVGQQFLLAVAHFPAVARHDQETFVVDVQVDL